MTPRDYLTIGRAVESLREEFADLTISKLRFLEEENIIRPGRTAGGYRMFTPAELERVRAALRLQRDHFLPLQVIRQKLDAMDRGAMPPELESVVTRPDRLMATRKGARPVKASEASQLTGLSPEQVKVLAEFGLVSPKQSEAGKFFSGDDIQFMLVARDFAELGIEPRHLRMYETVTEREAALFQQLLLPLSRQQGPEGKQRLAEMMGRLSQLSQEAKRLLLARALGVLFPEESGQ